MARESLYRYTIALCLGVIGFLLAHIFVINMCAREDASIILIQEAHIAKLRAHVYQSASSTEYQVSHADLSCAPK